MSSLYPRAVWNTIQSPLVLGGLVSASALVHAVVANGGWILRHALSSLSSLSHWWLPISSSPTTSSSRSSNPTTNPGMPLWVPWTASCLSLGLLVTACRSSITTVFGRFIQASIQSDLSNIPSVYFPSDDDNDKNNKNKNIGTFVVAVDQTSGRIIGCVGGEFKHQNKDENNEEPRKEDPDNLCATNQEEEESSQASSKSKKNTVVVELRRMVVDPAVHGRAVGRKLVATLESILWNQVVVVQKNTLQPTNPSSSSQNDPFVLHLTLTCSNIQVPAHKLYTKAGFTHTQTIYPHSDTRPRPPSRPPPAWWLRLSRFCVYRFDKTISSSFSTTTMTT